MNQTSLRFPNRGAVPLVLSLFIALVAACAPEGADAGESGLPVIRVEPDQTLNEAIVGVEGPILVLLPAGVTEHDAAITRNETVIIRGKGRDVSTLRPAASLGPDEGVALVAQTEGYDGDFILADLTYDRAHHPGITPGSEDVSTGATVMRVSAENRVEFRNVMIYHFDFGAREGENNNNVAFEFTDIVSRTKNRGEYRFHTKDIVWRNVEIDFAKGGGIRHRPGGHHHTFHFGTVDRIHIDGETRIVGHLCQEADPEYTVGEVWRGRGNAGPLQGMLLWVYDEALIDGEWVSCDYGAWRSGGVTSEDTVVEWRMNLIETGYADQFWHGPNQYGNPVEPFEGQAGHMTFRDVLVTSHKTDELWHDYGLRTFGDWKSITVENCRISGRGHALAFTRGGRQGPITVRDVTVEARGPALKVIAGEVESLTVEGMKVTRHPGDEGGFRYVFEFNETGEGGGVFSLANIEAEGFLDGFIKDRTGEETVIEQENVRAEKGEFELPEDVELGFLHNRMARPHDPRPTIAWHHVSSTAPGVKLPFEEVLSVAYGDRPDLGEGNLTVSYRRDGLHVYLFERSPGALATTKDEDPATANRIRIGLALGHPEDVDTWYEIEIAAREGDKPRERTEVTLRRYPGGEVLGKGALVEAGIAEDDRGAGRRHWAIRIPWEAVNIEIMDETLWVVGDLSFDFAYLAPEDTGALRFMGRSGVLEEKKVENFKAARALFVPWDDEGGYE